MSTHPASTTHSEPEPPAFTADSAVSARRYRALLTMLPALVMCCRQDGTYLEYNPAPNFPALLTPASAIGTHLRDHLPAEIAEIQLQCIQQAIAPARCRPLSTNSWSMAACAPLKGMWSLVVQMKR
ncbi:MAG: hypothetical protein HC838_10775 [Spirulinaceae cyanobacterium RM2_2_10]|nr:hypothetical protein [Spirulinaceae cyanobacterium RM2_2_10]